MSGPLLEDLRTFLAECTMKHDAANVSLTELARGYSRWASERGRENCSVAQFARSMEYLGYRPTFILRSKCYEGFYVRAHELWKPSPRLQDARPTSSHLSSLGLAGLHLEMVSAHASSLAARAASDTALIGQYTEELENQSIARDAFRAELERLTGLPADLIERRLAI